MWFSSHGLPSEGWMYYIYLYNICCSWIITQDHEPAAGYIAQAVDQQPSTLSLCYGCPLYFPRIITILSTNSMPYIPQNFHFLFNAFCKSWFKLNCTTITRTEWSAMVRPPPTGKPLISTLYGCVVICLVQGIYMYLCTTAIMLSFCVADLLGRLICISVLVSLFFCTKTTSSARLYVFSYCFRIILFLYKNE